MEKKFAYEKKGILTLMGLFFFGILGYMLYMAGNHVLGGSYGAYPFMICEIGVLICLVFWYRKGTLNETRIIGSIFALSMALKLDYIYYTSCYMRQQDTLIFDYPMGHLGYIGYLFYNRHLPDFDPRTAWSFSHPPLHHAISALWVKISMKLGFEQEMAIENIQLLTLFYSMGIMVFMYLILKELNISSGLLYAIMIIIAFHPTFILMSGSINNDELSVMFAVAAMLYTIRWFKDSSLKNILILAVMIGCAMMAKVSAGLIAPAIAVLFLWKFIKEKKEWKAYIKQFLCFGIVVFPLGLWAPLRNKILFDVPLNYAEKLKLTDPQYIGDVPLIRRFTDFSAYQLEHLNIQFEEAETYREFNVFLSLLKTTIFGYFDFYQQTKALTVTGTILFYLNVILVLAAIIFGIRAFWKWKDSYKAEKVFFLLLLITFMGSYFQFCVQYPHICTMNVRYIMPVLTSGLFFIVIGIKQTQGRMRNIIEMSFLIVAMIWMLSSILMFYLLGL